MELITKIKIGPQYPNVWVTSDTHFGHKNIIRLAGRPFNNVEEMDQGLIDRWNSVVDEDDLVIHLGDFHWHKPSMDYRAALKGEIYFLPGNHDQSVDYGQFEKILAPQVKVDYEGTRFVMNHFPMFDWDKSRHGSVHLHGHLHRKPNDPIPTAHGPAYEVGVDANGWVPVNLKEYVVNG